MRTLPPIKPSREQLRLISDNRNGVEIIRGAAGSGKTSTAILRLRSQLYMVQERLARENIDRQANILVLTFNRTLSGYIRVLASEQIVGAAEANITIDTFGRWAMANLDWPNVVNEKAREAKLGDLSAGIPLSARYIYNEVEYLLGRFEPENLENYVTLERTGRGAQPRVERSLRRQILDQVVYPYRAWLRNEDYADWNDVAVMMKNAEKITEYDVVIVDECQDFSANQLRAVRAHTAEFHAVTFVTDTVQRIYSRGFTWQETGFDLKGARYHTLQENHRNTKEIARFAAGILKDIVVEADGTMPDLSAATRSGALPTVLVGLYRNQVDAAISFIKQNINLREETVAFLAPQGGRFFDFLKGVLDDDGFSYVEITREAEWPGGPENMALSTFHSAKGLEFDHVFILGLSAKNTAHEEEARGDQLSVLRRLLGVAVARARLTLHLGYKPGEQSVLVSFFESGSFVEVQI